jgi:hypothetical protein
MKAWYELRSWVRRAAAQILADVWTSHLLSMPFGPVGAVKKDIWVVWGGQEGRKLRG